MKRYILKLSKKKLFKTENCKNELYFMHKVKLHEYGFIKQRKFSTVFIKILEKPKNQYIFFNKFLFFKWNVLKTVALSRGVRKFLFKL